MSVIAPAGEFLSGAAGIRLRGFDLTRPLDAQTKDAIRAVILAYHVVVFPNQSLTRERQFAFAALFGEVEAHGHERGERKRLDVAHVMSNLDPDGKPTIRTSPAANYHWHTDKPYRPAPPCPASGGTSTA